MSSPTPFSEEALVDGYSFSESGTYLQPPEGPIDHYKTVIDSFPDFEKPEVFGMNENANITFKLTESKHSMQTILSVQPRNLVATGTNNSQLPKTSDQLVEDLCALLDTKLPFVIKESSGDL